MKVTQIGLKSNMDRFIVCNTHNNSASTSLFKIQYG